tara:strand:+ start:2107 stop:2475 length:369 start_codon:yes stop_codon:yes gene_type:complete
MEKQVNWYEAMHGKSPYESMSQGIIEEKEDTMAGPKSTNWNTNYKIIEKQNDRLHTLRPPYYGGKDNTYEVFNVLESWNLDKDFYLGNVIKYVVRAGKKDSTKQKEDLKKALVYLQKRIDSL